ncbi:MAG TPA: oxidoreductase [Oligoflexus sp.]|uniref:oxidoreductase n=1 Tax=Oligoflexus sp. TaxID=1971216 RepID=UPI002D3AF6C7|nr:oxidoreductase [Oligoflexus sp.]HYX35688.1 oxidoreductase [Oligoflexus sp.]
MQAVIVGATGLVGGCVIQELLAEPRYTHVTSIGRRSQAPQVKKWTERIGPMSDMDALWSEIQADVAFCCLGTTIRKAGSQEAFAEIDWHLPVRFARVARQKGVKQLHVVSSLGADARSKTFYLQTKGRMEEDLKTLGFETLVIYRPSLLLGEREEKRPFEHFSAAAYRFVEPYYPRFLQTWKPIDAKDVAQVMVQQSLAGIPGTRIMENRDMHAQPDQS